MGTLIWFRPPETSRGRTARIVWTVWVLMGDSSATGFGFDIGNLDSAGLLLPRHIGQVSTTGRLSCQARAIRVVAAASRRPPATRTIRAGQPYAAATQLTSRPPVRRPTIVGDAATLARTRNGRGKAPA